MSLWDDRAAANEALFRSVNERVEYLAGRNFGPVERTAFVCECADDTCTARIYVPLGTYETVRENPRRFLIALGHDNSAFERVVDTGSEFAIVEKEGDAADVAEDTDPRG
jgi:hypothetical protein